MEKVLKDFNQNLNFFEKFLITNDTGINKKSNG